MIGYVRVSRESGENAGEIEQAGLAAQRNAIEKAHERGAFEKLDRIEAEVLSARSLKRPVLQEILADLEAGRSDGIVVAKLDRLSRSVIDFAQMLAVARKQGWNIVALDFGLDLWTPQGELVANVLMSVAQWERRIIGQRTSDALQALKRQGKVLGRASAITPEIRAEIVAMRAGGMSVSGICRELNRRSIPTPRGGLEWRPSSITHICNPQA